MSNNNMKFEHSMQELAELFEVNTFVNQTFVLDEFIEKLSDYISERVNLNQISFYVFENEVFKLVPTKQNSFGDEYFELESGNDALWAVLSSRKLVKTFEDDQPIFRRFLRNCMSREIFIRVLMKVCIVHPVNPSGQSLS